MKIIVTGSDGQLASDLIPALQVARFTTVGVDIEDLDITDRDKVFDFVKEAKPALIINCAAYTLVDKAEIEKDKAFKVNSEGAINLALAAKRAGAPLIHVSTDFVFDGEKNIPYTEKDPVNPLSTYGSSKLKGEAGVRDALIEHMIVRTSWLYGTSGHNFVKTILRYASEREFLRVVYDQTGGPTWTEDLSHALVRIVKAYNEDGRLDYGVYHYSNEGVASWYDFAVAVIELAVEAGINIRCKRIEPILTTEYPTPAKRPPYSVLDKRKIKATFGIAVPHWRASLKEMIKNYYGGIHE